MAGKVSTRKVTERRVTARPAGTSAPAKNKNSANSTPAPAPNSSSAPPVSDLADHMAQVLTGKKKLAPTPEHLDLEAKIKKAWAEGWRGFEKRDVKERDELFERPILKVEIGGYGVGKKGERKYYGPGRVLIDRLDELAAVEGFTVS